MAMGIMLTILYQYSIHLVNVVITRLNQHYQLDFILFKQENKSHMSKYKHTDQCSYGEMV